jgi:hypothetical protein
MHTVNIKAQDYAEQDVVIEFPGGKCVVLQYRNYDGDPDTLKGSTIDICLPDKTTVYCWEGVDMLPAKPGNHGRHTRVADQIMFVYGEPFALK